MLLSIAALVLICLQVKAQDGTAELSDDLVSNKDKILSKYLPMHNGTYLYKVYTMPVAEATQQFEASRKEMQPQVVRQKTAALKLLAQKDADYHLKRAMGLFFTLYGMDSLAMDNVQKIITTKRNDTNFMALMMDAHRKVFVKRLAPQELKMHLEELYGNPELNNEVLYKRSAAYRIWLDDYITYLKGTKYSSDRTLGAYGTPVVKLKIVKAEISAGFINNYLNYKFTMEILKMVKDSAAKATAYNEFMAGANPATYKKEVEAVYANNKMMDGKGPSPEFVYADSDGKQISLHSLRGKYVYIDVWATWCAPCKAEIPFLQKIEESYEGKKIQFVSLSVDRLVDKDKWISYVRENKLGGIQVMADRDFNSDFIKKYNINSIPRFILIDPTGNIVSGDAYRPSDPLLRKQLDGLLN